MVFISFFFPASRLVLNILVTWSCGLPLRFLKSDKVAGNYYLFCCRHSSQDVDSDTFSNWGLHLQELEHLKALAIIMTLVVFLTVVMTFVLLKRVIEALSITKVHQFLTLQDINSILLYLFPCLIA